jgi:hypothetical protein
MICASTLYYNKICQTKFGFLLNPSGGLKILGLNFHGQKFSLFLVFTPDKNEKKMDYPVCKATKISKLFFSKILSLFLIFKKNNLMR